MRQHRHVSLFAVLLLSWLGTTGKATAELLLWDEGTHPLGTADYYFSLPEPPLAHKAHTPNLAHSDLPPPFLGYADIALLDTEEGLIGLEDLHIGPGWNGLHQLDSALLAFSLDHDAAERARREDLALSHWGRSSDDDQSGDLYWLLSSVGQIHHPYRLFQHKRTQADQGR